MFQLANGYEILGDTSTCTTLDDPANGEIIDTFSYNDGDVAVYSCNAGFELQGGSTRTCTNGRWSGTAITCISSG